MAMGRPKGGGAVGFRRLRWWRVRWWQARWWLLRRRWQSTALRQPATWPRRAKITGVTALVLLVLVAMTVTAYRTLRPAEDLRQATAPLPSSDEAQPLSFGELGAAPLIVDGRLRIFTEQRRIWAETPVTAPHQVTPHWSYRRWPAESVGVVTVEPAFLWGGPSLVITKWSDGAIVALDSASGEMVWQARVDPDPEETYRGRRTGGQTVYAPDGMFTAVGVTDGKPVLLVAGKDQIRGYDPFSGTQKWEHPFAGGQGCHRVDWTGETTYVVKDSCAAPATLEIYDAASGEALGQWRPPGASAGPGREANWFAQPVACGLGRSRCRLFRASPAADVIPAVDAARGVQGVVAGVWSLGLRGEVAAELGAESDSPMVVGDIRVEQMLNGYVWASSRSTRVPLWFSTRPVILLAVDGSSAYLADRDRDLIVVDITTGKTKAMIVPPARYGTNWLAGQIYVHHGYLAIERLASGRESDADVYYYYAPNPILLVGV